MGKIIGIGGVFFPKAVKVDELLLWYKGVLIHTPLKSYEYGEFVRIYDPNNRVIELCELNHEFYKGMVRREIEEYKKRSK